MSRPYQPPEGPPSDSPSSFETHAPRPWWRSLLPVGVQPPSEEFSLGLGLRVVVLFAILDIAFCAVSITIGWALGYPLDPEEQVTTSFAARDAGWHALTGLILALPTRNLRLYVLGPLLTTEIDIDHLFGTFLPSDGVRPAHDLFFLVLLVVVLFLSYGRSAAYLGAGGFLAHIALDGGKFPFLSPITLTQWPLPLVGEAALALVSMILLYFAVFHPKSRYRLLWDAAGVVAVFVLVLALLWAGGPALVQTSGV